MTIKTNPLIKQLKDVGFKQNESEVYLFLLQNGISTPPQIAKGTHIARTNCYRILDELKEKSVVDEQKKGKRAVYVARPPESLKLNLEHKLETITTILPDLKAEYVIQKNKPTFRFYDGWKEVKQIYELTLSAKEIYATGSINKLNELDQKFFQNYMKTFNDKKIVFYDLLSANTKQNSGKIIEGIVNSVYQVKFLPEQYKENLTDLLIWDDNIALIALDEPIFGTVVTNPSLAQTFKTLLKIIWDKL